MKRNFGAYLILVVLLLPVVFAACDRPVVLPWEPGRREEPKPTPQPEDTTHSEPADTTKPKPQPEPQPESDSLVNPRFVWIDAAANFQYFANDVNRISSDLKKVKEAGFTDIVVDVRPTEATVLFKSSTAPATKRLAAWVGGKYKFIERTKDFDYLQAFIEAGHNLGLRVNAAINTFVGGYGGIYTLDDEGPIFTGNIPKEWATVVNYADGLRSSLSEDADGTIFLNPANDAVQEYLLKVIADLAKYEVDGIFLDRCRYDDTNLGSDFSAESKTKFEAYLGKAVQKWPVFNAGVEKELPKSLTSEQKSWLGFRAKTIHDFVEKASATVHAANPGCRFGCYVGAWYSQYYLSGVNWASPKYDTSNHWAYSGKVNADYKNYGYADHCDFILLGCYAATTSIYGSSEWTMQGFCKEGRKLLLDTPFAGGPDIGNGTGWENGGCGDLIPKTIDACIKAADGYFVFDLCHIRMYDYWKDFKTGFQPFIQ